MADASYSDQCPPSADDSRSNPANQNLASEQPTVQQALDRLQLITQAAQLYWWEWNLLTNQTTYSPNTEQIIGRPPAQSLQENLQLLHPDDRHLNQQAMEQAQKEGTDSFQYQVRSIAMPAQLKWLQVSGQLYRDEQRQVVRVIGVTQDITARKRAEDALQENQQQQTYLLHLSDTLRTLADPIRIQQAAMQLLGMHLQVSRAFYGDMQADQDTLLIGPGYARDTFPLELQVRFSEFDADLIAYYGKGQTVVMEDVNDHPLVSDQSKAEFALIDCRAAVGVPLLKGGSIRAILSLHQRVPRQWTATEIALAQETAERTWAAVERAKAEETLRQREQRLQRMVNVPRVGVLTFDYSGQLLEANDAFLAMVGYERAELAARAFTWRDFTPAEYVGESERMMQTLLTTMQGGPYEKEYFRKDGSRVWLMLVGANLGDGTLVEYALDISDGKRAEAALRQSEARQRAILQSAKDYAIFTTDLDRLVTSWSRGAQTVFGYEPADMLHQSADRLFTPDDRQQGVPQQEAQTAAREGEAQNERWHIRQDGTRFYGSGVVTPLHDEMGSLVGLLTVLRDMTDQKRAEEALQLADQRKDEFLAMLAHELRNPMSTLRSGLQILTKIDGKDPVSRDTITMMNRQTDHLVRMVDDLLDVSRISQGKIELKTQRIDLVEVVTQAAQSVQALYQEQGRHLQVDLPTSMLEVEGDPARLTQVVTNLLTNGARYTEAEGSVWLSLVHQDQEAVLQVRDNGIGLAADQLTAIFELFVQVDNSLARSKGGLGLGLTLVKRLVELHSGWVDAHSEGVGKGSTFRVHLPTLHTAPQRILASAEDHPADITTRLILVVDDNADAALTLSMLLRLEGYHVQTRHSGLAGLEAVEDLKPRVVLLDIGMPGMDGYETARAIRQQAWGRAVILIALTGYGGQEDKQRAQEAGFDGHLVKPVDLGALQALLISKLSTP